MNITHSVEESVSGTWRGVYWTTAFTALCKQSIMSTELLVKLGIIMIVVIMLATRIYSGLFLASSNVSPGVKTVGIIPYWIPYLGHAFADPLKLIQSSRDRSGQGIIAVNILGSTHHLAYSPAIIQQVYQQDSSTLDFESVAWLIIQRNFGAPSKLRSLYEATVEEMNELFTSTPHQQGSHLAKMLSATIRNMEEDIPNLVSFMSSPIDQSPWERASNTTVVKKASEEEEEESKADALLAVETNLYSLVRHFIGHMVTSALMGRDFIDNYPDVLQDLWRLDQGAKYLTAGIPRWVPIPAVSAAYAAQARLLRGMTAFHHALDAHVSSDRDPGSQWAGLDDVSDLMKQRHLIWRKHGASPRMRAPMDVSLLWAVNSQSSHLAFWLLVRILSDASSSSLAHRIRQETAPFVTVTQPPPPSITTFGISEPARLDLSATAKEWHSITLDSSSSSSSCPCLRSIYLETLRYHTSPWSIHRVAKDFLLKNTESSPPFSLLIPTNTLLSIPLQAHHMNPEVFPKPHVFLPNRFLDLPSSSLLHPCPTPSPGPGHILYTPRLVLAEILVFAVVVGFLNMWDFEVVVGGGGASTMGGSSSSSSGSSRLAGWITRNQPISSSSFFSFSSSFSLATPSLVDDDDIRVWLTRRRRR